MGRRGPEPKSPDQVSREQARKPKSQIRLVQSEAVPAPELPENPFYDDWPDQTLAWWEVWSNSPLTEDYRAEDWQDLIDCAVIHSRLWSGETRAASELRLRMARHGATREDRARLRIVFATADQIEKKSKDAANPATPERQGSRGRRGGLSAVEAG
jgi:hypothetical protein